MRPDVSRDLSDSARDFVDVVWPAINHLCGGGDILPVEAITTDKAKTMLDQTAGVDAWQVLRDPSAMRGISSRVQWGEVPYNTFSIRLSRSTGAATEFEKRFLAITNGDRGYLYPHLTIQAYLRSHGGPLLSAAVVKTADLFLFANEYRDSLQIRLAPDGNQFLVVPWLQLRSKHCRIHIISPAHVPDTLDRLEHHPPQASQQAQQLAAATLSAKGGVTNEISASAGQGCSGGTQNATRPERVLHHSFRPPLLS